MEPTSENHPSFGAPEVAQLLIEHRNTLIGYLQQWDAAERGDSPRNENGFLDPFEKPFTEWTQVIKDINAQATTLHQSAK